MNWPLPSNMYGQFIRDCIDLLTGQREFLNRDFDPIEFIKEFDDFEDEVHNIVEGNITRATYRKRLTVYALMCKNHLNKRHVLPHRRTILVTFRCMYEFLYGSELAPIIMVKELGVLDYQKMYLN